MVKEQICRRGITDQLVLDAMRKVPRHLFLEKRAQGRAYSDYPVEIGFEQTISQPYIVALMTENLKLSKNDIVLEIGTGSGYQTAVLAEIAGKVYSIEIKTGLYKRAIRLLNQLSYNNIELFNGDGYKGLELAAPFTRIIITAASPKVPVPLINQLSRGGRMVVPLGPPFSVQELVLIKKDRSGISKNRILSVRFVPMTGIAQKNR